MNTNYCPLTFSSNFDKVNLSCEKDKCPWWNERECSVVSIAKSMEKIAKLLSVLSAGYIDDGK